MSLVAQETPLDDQTPRETARDRQTGLSLDFDDLVAGDELEDRVRSGELTGDQAAGLLQQAARRQTAMHCPACDTNEDGIITTGGFGSGQGMAHHSSN